MNNTSLLKISPSSSISVQPHGLRIHGDLDLEEWSNLLRSLRSVKHAYHCALGDVVAWGRRKFGDEQVACSLEQMEFDLQECTKADAIARLPFTFRETYPLTSEHYFVLAGVEDEDARKRWASAALVQRLSALELKRSIGAGKVLRLTDIQNQSGQGSGINTIQGAIFRLNQWSKHVGGPDAIRAMPLADRQNLLTVLRPAIELAALVEASLS